MVYSAASKSENVQGELILNLVYCAKLYYQKVYININDNNDITIIIIIIIIIIIVVIRKFVCDSNYIPHSTKLQVHVCITAFRLGLILMVLGEIGNFSAYGFSPASLVAPLGTTTVIGTFHSSDGTTSLSNQINLFYFRL